MDGIAYCHIYFLYFFSLSMRFSFLKTTMYNMTICFVGYAYTGVTTTAANVGSYTLYGGRGIFWKQEQKGSDKFILNVIQF